LQSTDFLPKKSLKIIKDFFSSYLTMIIFAFGIFEIGLKFLADRN